MEKGIKFNNPGNLVKGPYIFVGEKISSDDLVYRQFYEMAYGVRAIFKQLQLYITVGHNDIRSIINLWSGESKDKTEPYIDFVSTKLQALNDKRIGMKDVDDLKKLVAAIYEYESGEKPKFEDIEMGYELVMGGKII